MSSPQTLKKKIFGHEKRPFELQQKMLSLQLATQLLYRPYESYHHSATKQKRLMVKVLSTLLCLPGSKPSHRTTRPVRGQLQKGEVHENRERDRGRVREQGDVVCLKALNENLGMAAGGTLRSTEVVV